MAIHSRPTHESDLASLLALTARRMRRAHLDSLEPYGITPQLSRALAMIERLTPGALTGGAHVAVTGTVTADGRVGAIGGIAQKVRGAADAGATAFLAPAENCAELAGRVPEGIDVYAVDTLDTARRALEELGRGQTPDGVPPCG